MREALQGQRASEAAMMMTAETFNDKASELLVSQMTDGVGQARDCVTAKPYTGDQITKYAEGCIRLDPQRMVTWANTITPTAPWAVAPAPAQVGFTARSFGDVTNSPFFNIEVANLVDSEVSAGYEKKIRFSQLTVTVFTQLKASAGVAAETLVVGRGRITVGPHHRERRLESKFPVRSTTPMNSSSTTHAVRRFGLLGAIGAVSLTVLGISSDASAQIAGTTTRPLPNVLLLVDSSGSMERMADNSLPSDNRGSPTPPSICSPGVASTPNRWGMLLQALTGNLQPFYSCDAIDRTTSSFKNEFRIGPTPPVAANLPYDADYFLPYHRPLTGDTAANACAFAPFTLPGAAPGQGIGPGGGGVNTGSYTDSSSFPPEAFQPFKETYIRSQCASGFGSPLSTSLASNLCTFEQANDGQLDAARDYIRFGLMMFDNDPSAAIGVTTNPTPNGGAALTSNPFAGQWSYVKSPSNPGLLGVGRPVGCATTSPFEVGARHWAAPPWEGRMVRFPDPDGSLYDIARTNDEIQKVLLGTRPYGATPIDGMMEDARDYFWYNDYGPLGTQAGYRDAYVNASCREQYIVLLTDGAPNLDMRPSCEPGLPAGQCPYPNKAAQVADQLSNAVSASQRVKTYVIGFSVNGAGSATFTNDGFPPAFNALTVPPSNNCKAWFNSVTSGGTNLPAMHSVCDPMSGVAPPKGSTADACCSLSEIAYYGSGPAHDTPPFFAENQADLVLSFGRVLGGISKTATTRTLPGYSPAVSISGQGVTGDFVASFIPNAQKVWSGEIDRTRSVCVGAVPTPSAQSVAAGDSFSANTAAQAAAGKRLFISVKGQTGTAALPLTGTVVDSARTIRPWAAGLDGIVAGNSGGAQVAGIDLGLASTSDWAAALSIDDNTCKRSRDITGATIPKLDASQCTNVIWGFTAAHAASQGPLTFNGYDFNVRCRGTASATAGFCSVSGGGCTLNGTACPTAGEVCVPECSALGAIYRSSPTLNGPPNDALRDDAYRSFSDLHKFRRPAMFVATTDGILHAFKALSTSGSPTFDNVAAEHELWAFIPPAVLPKLASNYPTGQQLLLDGTPALKDIVWDRTLRTEAPLYHTTLVSGMGAGGGGYYALNVSDSDCQGFGSTGIGVAPNGCLPAGSISTPASLTNLASSATKGPQFLWQLTDVESNGATDPAKKLRSSRDGKDFVALFGKESGNAAIGTLLMNPDGVGVRQIGVAILPGGIDGPPIKGGSCPRAINGGAQIAFPALTNDASDSTTPLAPRANVRQWAAGSCLTAPVPGRNVTIVRADTGEIIRVFGRPNQDIPQKLNGVRTDAPFDSPIIGTPAIFPSGIGLATQKIFVGDADGTLWRIDVSDPTPANWKVTLFQDLVSANLAGGPSFNESQPISIPPVLTQDAFGSIVITAATGDQENVVASPSERNYVMSIQEQKAASASVPGRALVKWYQTLTNAQRVTGPMTVFDRTLYFATFQPVVPTAGACTNGGTALLWGMDYLNPNSTPGTGGLPRWCPINRVDPVSGACLDPLVQNENPAVFYPSLLGAIIPGVTIRATQSCASYTGSPTDPVISGATGTTFSLFFGATAAGTGGAATGTPQAARPTSPLVRPLPRTPANIDSWALVVD